MVAESEQSQKGNSIPTAAPFETRRQTLRWVVAIVALLAGAAWFLSGELQDPEVRLLIPEHGARWIRLDQPFDLAGRGASQEIIYFRRQVDVSENPGSATLTLRAMRICMNVTWDGKTIFTGSEIRDQWKRPHSVSLTPVLTPGRHELAVTVENINGPAALLAYCEELGILTGSDWESRAADTPWSPSRDVAETTLPKISRQFESPTQALRNRVAWLVPLFLTLWGIAAWSLRRFEKKSLGESTTQRIPALLRWMLIGGWLALAMNNFQKLPAEMGYDFAGHRAYIEYLLQKGKLPLASDGPQMFQSPLYYVLSAGLFRLLRLFVSDTTAWLGLRWIPLLCWLAQIEIIYRLGKLTFPRRPELQSCMLLFGGLLPMGISMSQVVGNEPLCAVLTSLVLLMCCRGLIDETYLRLSRRHWWLGVWLGLALLTKVSALLLIPLVCGVLFIESRRTGGFSVIAGLARCLTAATAIAGWFYFRNWIEFGKPFIGGWDPVTGIVWWQDSGYRTPEQMLTFGSALRSPIHAGFHSIWDGFYSTFWLDGILSGMGADGSRPPWQYSWMLACVWPGLILTVVLIIGLIRSLRRKDLVALKAWRLAAAALVIYLAAFTLLCLRVPAYSQAKASYTLGLTPAYALLFVAGFDCLPRHWLIRSASWAFLGSWVVLVIGAYVVL